MRKIMFTMAALFLIHRSAYSYDLSFLEIHGFASPGYIVSSNNNYIAQTEDGSFQFNEFGINFATTVKDDIYIGLQLLSRDMGTVGNNDVKLNWGLIDYQWRDELGFKLGQIKLPHGLYNDTRDYDMLRTAILLPQSIYNEISRDTYDSYTGTGVYGNLSLGQGGLLGYEFFLGKTEIPSDGGISRIINSEDIKLISADMDYIAGNRLKWQTPLTGLTLAASFYQMDASFKTEAVNAPVITNLDRPETRSVIFSCEYIAGNLTAAAEYNMLKSDQTVTIDMSRLGRPDPPPFKMKIDQEGYYGSLSYRFTDWFEAASYYSVYYYDKNDRGGNKMIAQGKPDFKAWQKDTAFSARFDINEYWLVKLEFHLMDGDVLCTELDNPDGYDKNWTLFAIRTTFSF